MVLYKWKWMVLVLLDVWIMRILKKRKKKEANDILHIVSIYRLQWVLVKPTSMQLCLPLTSYGWSVSLCLFLRSVHPILSDEYGHNDNLSWPVISIKQRLSWHHRTEQGQEHWYTARTFHWMLVKCSWFSQGPNVELLFSRQRLSLSQTEGRIKLRYSRVFKWSSTYPLSSMRDTELFRLLKAKQDFTRIP